MKKSLFILVVAALLASGPLYALAGGNRVKADVPFAFTVGSQSLPAGKYTVQKEGAHQLLVRDGDRAVRAIVFASGSADGAAEDARFTFRRYGHRTFLASVEAPGFGAREVRPTSEEREIASAFEKDARYRVDVDATIEP